MSSWCRWFLRAALVSAPALSALAAARAPAELPSADLLDPEVTAETTAREEEAPPPFAVLRGPTRAHGTTPAVVASPSDREDTSAGKSGAGAERLAGDALRLRYFSLGDLHVVIERFDEEIQLKPSSFIPADAEPLPDPPAIFPVDRLIEGIREAVDPESWFEEGALLEVKGTILIARARPATLASVGRLLDEVRGARGRAPEPTCAMWTTRETSEACLIRERMEQSARVLAYLREAALACERREYATAREYARAGLREDPALEGAARLIAISYDLENSGRSSESQTLAYQDWMRDVAAMGNRLQEALDGHVEAGRDSERDHDLDREAEPAAEDPR